MSEPEPVQKLFGAALMAIGGLIAALSGACTLLVIGVTLFSMVQNPANLELMLTGVFSGALVVAIVGGTPIVVGILIFRWGWGLYRPPPQTEGRGDE